MKKYFSDHISCMDIQYIDYNVHYDLTVSYSLFNFNIRKNIEEIKNEIVFLIKSYFSTNKLKYFVKTPENDYQKESNTYLDYVKTTRAENEAYLYIKTNIIDILHKKGIKLVDFKWTPMQLSHTLEAALS